MQRFKNNSHSLGDKHISGGLEWDLRRIGLTQQGFSEGQTQCCHVNMTFIVK